MQRAIGPIVALGLLLAGAPAFAGECDNLKMCFKDSLGTGAGKSIKWFKKPIPYKINASLLPVGKRQAAIDAVKAAFKAYELPCTSLKFSYEGASTSFSDVKGHILIYWGHATKDASSWIHGSATYFRQMYFTSYQTGEIDRAYVALNAKNSGWYAGKTEVVPPPSATRYAQLDIKTVMMWMIPDLIGYMVSTDLSKAQLPIKYSTTLPALCKEHKDGAMYTYFQAGTGCKKPTKPAHCLGGPKPGDLGPLDGFFTDGPAPKKDKGGSSTADKGGSTTNDAGTGKACTSTKQCAADEVCTVEGYCKKVTTGGDDDGCSVAGSTSGLGTLWVLLGLALVGWRRRRG